MSKKKSKNSKNIQRCQRKSKNAVKKSSKGKPITIYGGSYLQTWKFWNIRKLLTNSVAYNVRI